MAFVKGVRPFVFGRPRAKKFLIFEKHMAAQNLCLFCRFLLVGRAVQKSVLYSLKYTTLFFKK